MYDTSGKESSVCSVCVYEVVCKTFKYVCKTTHTYTHLTWPYEVSAEIRSKSDSRHAGYFKYLIRNFKYLLRIKLPRKDLIRMDFLRRPGCEHKLPEKKITLSPLSDG